MIQALRPIHQAITTYWSYPVGMAAALELGRGREWSYQKKVIASAAAILVVTLAHQLAQHLEKLPPSPLVDSLKQVAPYFALLLIGDHFFPRSVTPKKDEITATCLNHNEIHLCNAATSWEQKYQRVPVPPQGDCLFHALLGGEIQSDQISDLRKALADHINAHFEEYRAEIRKELNALKVADFNSPSVEDYTGHWSEGSLKEVIANQHDNGWLNSRGIELYLTELCKGSWGTSVEIKAFCQLQGDRVAVVEVYTGEGAPLVACNVYGPPTASNLIAIVNDNGAHYDALVVVT